MNNQSSMSPGAVSVPKNENTCFNPCAKECVGGNNLVQFSRRSQTAMTPNYDRGRIQIMTAGECEN